MESLSLGNFGIQVIIFALIIRLFANNVFFFVFLPGVVILYLIHRFFLQENLDHGMEGESHETPNYLPN